MGKDRYTVIRTNDCIVIEGAIPLGDVAALLGSWSASQTEWILDAALADHLGVPVVAGTVRACRAWKERLGIEPEGPPLPPIGSGQGSTHGKRYRLVSGPYDGIECLQCGRISYNPNDVVHRFCGHCDDFLEE